ncbi:MAG: esterase [Bacteroidetes bacterium]|nr:esterase [Bacteroidota bacterium]
MLNTFWILMLINMLGQSDRKEIKTLTCLVKEPKLIHAQTPVIILLHGLRSNEQDLFTLSNQLPEACIVVSARAPIQLGDEQYAWYEVDLSTGKPVFNIQQEQRSRNLLFKLIEELREVYKLKGNPVVLAGFSQGGILSYNCGIQKPEMFRGIGIFSGRLQEEIRGGVTSKALQKFPIFIAHGIQDNVLPIDYARDAKRWLQEHGAMVIYYEFNAGHTVTALEIQHFNQWLDSLGAFKK